MRSQPFSEEEVFWDREAPRLVGDHIARPHIISLAGDVRNKSVLDMGCGCGYVAQQLADRGAGNVVGYDREAHIIDTARRHAKNPALRYFECDITDSTVVDAASPVFDIALLVSVLMYLPEISVKLAVKHAFEALKPGGLLLFSVTDPGLGEATSPAMNKRSGWLGYELLSREETSLQILQTYVDIAGNESHLAAWCHPKPVYQDALFAAGFVDIEEFSLPYTTEVASLSPFWMGPTGYPAYWQVRARKPA